MSEPPSWLGWVLPSIGVTAVIGAIAKWLFTQAVRLEMNGMHQENLTRFSDIDGRVREMEGSLERIEGRLQERWGDRRE